MKNVEFFIASNNLIKKLPLKVKKWEIDFKTSGFKIDAKGTVINGQNQCGITPMNLKFIDLRNNILGNNKPNWLYHNVTVLQWQDKNAKFVSSLIKKAQSKPNL